MSFWSDEHKAVGGEFESAGGSFEPIPANTGCLAVIQDASWKEYNGDRYINIKWQIIQPEQYKNRVIFQKIRALDDDAARADRAKRMLAAIATNAGGGLLQVQGEPTDSDLAVNLVGKIQGIKLQVWELTTETGEERSGNWVSAVAPSNGGQQPRQVQQPVAQQNDPVDASFEDVPF